MEPISSVPNQSAESTIHTAGGAYISGSVVAETFIGRDQYNYYFIGLAPLVHDPTRRFRNFLNEYLGTPGHPVPFGGRQAQLEELHRWLNDAAAPPYYLMTAEAGRGKSALVCRWMEEVRHKRPEVEVIFIPISIRFETAAQDTVFAALAARLAQFYDEPLKPAALSGAQWQGVCESYLDRTPPAGKQLLIILDGLDEATGWHFGAGFFSTEPPPRLRVVVTARLRVGESTPHGWATTLGWHERLTKMVTLPPLSRVGIEEALTSMGDPLAGFADQATIVEQLYRLTEGDPLLVRLYVQEFEKQKATVGTLDSAALQQMTPGLQGYFDQWWKGQKAQWRAQGNDPEKEEAQLRLLLDALAAALGPLTLDDLAQLHPDLGSSRLIRAQLQSVERWVIGDGKTQGYSYSHPRLGYYFWEQLSDKEQSTWDERFCAWGATTLAALDAEQLDPKAAPVYLLRHYCEHLERSHAPSEAFYALICNGWRKAWEELDISYSGFLGDVDWVRQCAVRGYNSANSSKAVMLVQQIKMALCKASITAIQYKMSPELLAQAARVGLRTPIQALAIAKLAPTEHKRASILSLIASILPTTLLSETLSITLSIESEHHRSTVLVSLAPYLSVELLNQALAATYLICDEHCRTVGLSGLVPYLPSVLLDKILAAALLIGNEEYRAMLLGTLASYLPMTLLGEALVATRSIQTERFRAEVLCKLGPYLPKNLLGEVLNDVRHIESDTLRASILGSIAPYLPSDLLEEALEVTRIIGDDASRASLLRSIVPNLSCELLEEALIFACAIKNNTFCAEVLHELDPYLPKNLLGEALNIISSIKDDSDRAALLCCFAPYLPSNLLEEALIAAHAIADWIPHISALTSLVPYLSENERRKVIKEVLSNIYAIGKKISDGTMLSRYTLDVSTDLVVEQALSIATVIKASFSCADALREFIKYLPNDLLEDALSATLTIKDEMSRAIVLSEFASRLPADLLRKALEAVRTIKDEASRAIALRGLSECVEERERTQILEEALIATCSIGVESFLVAALREFALSLAVEVPIVVSNATYNIKESQRYRIRRRLTRSLSDFHNGCPEHYLAAALGDLVPYIAQSERMKIFSKTLEIIKMLEDEPTCIAALRELVPHLPTELLDEALYVIRKIENATSRACMLCDVAPFFSKDKQVQILEEALATTCDIIGYEFYRANTLYEIAIHSPENTVAKILKEVLVNVNTIRDNYHQLFALITLAQHLPISMLRIILADVYTVRYEPDRVSLLIALAPHLPDILLKDLLEIIHSITDEINRSSLLVALVPYLPDALFGEVLEIIRTIEDQSIRATVLSTFMLQLPENELLEVLEEVLAVARMIRDKSDRTNTLTSLILRLPESRRANLIEETLNVMRTIENKSSLADALRDLALYLPESERVKIIRETLEASDAIPFEFYRISTLNSLMTYLPENERSELLGQILNINGIIEDKSMRSNLFAALNPILSENEHEKVFSDALRIIPDIDDESYRTYVLHLLGPQLLNWSSKQKLSAYLAFAAILPDLATHPRPEFLSNLAALMPFILALAGDEAPQAAEGIYHAIQEVCGWWP